MSDLLLRQVRPMGGDTADVLVLNGKIEAIGPHLQAPPQTPEVDGRGLLLLPGAIDPHVHFRTPGGEHKETLLTGAQAAVKGGVTTCCDMPNTNPRTTSIEALEAKMALAEGALADVRYNFGAEPDNLPQVALAAKHPQVTALKIYIGPSTGQGGLARGAVEAHVRQAAELDLPVMVHAEDVDMIDAAANKHPHDAHHHHLLRPLEAELSAMEFALALGKKYPVKLYLAHVTSARVLDLAEQSGLRDRICVEACPHHLLLNTNDITPPLENRFRVNPPVRPPEEQQALLAALANRIDVIGSDHAPHTTAEKEAEYDKAPSGMPGVEYLLPLALNQWKRGQLSLERVVALTSGHAARFLGLNKGALEPGRDADLVLVDEAARWTIGEGDDQIASKCGWTPYAGRSVQSRPVMTIVGGRVVWRHDAGDETEL